MKKIAILMLSLFVFVACSSSKVMTFSIDTTSLEIKADDSAKLLTVVLNDEQGASEASVGEEYYDRFSYIYDAAKKSDVQADGDFVITIGDGRDSVEFSGDDADVSAYTTEARALYEDIINILTAEEQV